MTAASRWTGNRLEYVTLTDVIADDRSVSLQSTTSSLPEEKSVFEGKLNLV